MSKTPEEMAEELDRQAVLYVSLKARNDVSYHVGMDCYRAGYKAAQDQLADTSKVMPDTCEHILDMSKMVDVNWQELPEPPKEEK
jgi:hypothetical protein